MQFLGDYTKGSILCFLLNHNVEQLDIYEDDRQLVRCDGSVRFINGPQNVANCSIDTTHGSFRSGHDYFLVATFDNGWREIHISYLFSIDNRSTNQPTLRPAGKNKCLYCGLYGELGRCAGCGAPNTIN